MLWLSQVPAVFSKMNFQADSAATSARKKEAAKRIAYFFDQQLDELESLLEIYFSEPSKMTKVELNITKKIIKQLSQTYREAPVRAIDGTDADQELYASIVEKMSLNAKMKMASRYSKLLKTILLRPVFRGGRLDLDILTPNILDVETGDSPEQLLKVLVTDFGSTDKIEDIQYSLWTPELFERLDYQARTLYVQDNPYKVLPFLPVFDYPNVTSSFWLAGGDDLVSQQESVNLKITDLLYLIKMQSFGVGWTRGTSGGANLVADPGSLVELGDNPEAAIGFESQEAEITQVVKAIDKIIKWACVSNGLSAVSMSTEVIEQSGIAKIVDTKELTEMREDDIETFRSAERSLFELMRLVHNTHAEKKLSESCTLSVDFADPKPAADPKTKAEADDIRLSQGIISPVDIALERNPDLATRENALIHLLRIKEENELLMQ